MNVLLIFLIKRECLCSELRNGVMSCLVCKVLSFTINSINGWMVGYLFCQKLVFVCLKLIRFTKHRVERFTRGSFTTSEHSYLERSY